MDIERIENILRKQEESLLQRLESIAKRRSRTKDLQNSDEMAQFEQDEEVVEDLETLEMQELKDVQAALRRIIEHSYGTCSVCYSEIDAKRIEAMPTVVTCIICAEKLERG